MDMPKLLSSALLLTLIAAPACADYCRTSQGGQLVSCGGRPAESWTKCGTMKGQSIWIGPDTACLGDGGAADSGKNSAKNTFVYVGVGLAFVAVMWYVFKAPPSTTNPGHVRLAEF